MTLYRIFLYLSEDRTFHSDNLTFLTYLLYVAFYTRIRAQVMILERDPIYALISIFHATRALIKYFFFAILNDLLCSSEISRDYLQNGEGELFCSI